MIYDKQKAQQIAEKYNISPSTIRAWRKRNQIPDRYDREDFIKPEYLTNSEKVVQSRIKELIDSKSININKLAELSGLDRNILQDIRRQDERNVNLKRHQLKALQKEINQMRLSTKRLVDQMDKKEVFTDLDRQKVFTLLDNKLLVKAHIFTLQDSKRFTNWKIKRWKPTDEWLAYMIDKLRIFILTTSL